MESGGGEKPLRRIAAAFEALEVSSKTAPMEVDAFSRACSQVEDLCEASKSISTLNNLLELDIQQDCVKQGGSHSRNLLRVKRGLDMVKVLFEQILEKDENSLRNPATVAYAKVFAPHHGWAIRKAVAAGMYALPSKAQLLKKLNEDEEASARTYMQTYIRSSGPVIAYIEELYNSRQMGIDW